MALLATELPFFDTSHELEPLETMRPTRIALPLLAAGFLIAPGSARAQTRRIQWQAGLELLQKGRDTEALDVFRKMTEQDPACLEAWNNRAALEAARGDLDAANASLEKALEAHPDLAMIQRNLSKVRSRQARLAYDSAFGTPSTLAPLQLDLQKEAPAQTAETGAEPPRDSLLQELENLRESSRREIARRDSLLEVESSEIQRLQTALDKAASGQTTGNRGALAAATPNAAETAPPPTVSRRRDPVPASRASDSRTGENADGVVKALQAWAQAWSSQDVEAYLACYSSHFAPSGWPDRSSWEAYRRDRLTSPKTIQVTVASTRVRLLKGHRAEISFRQNYQTESTRLTSRKRLEFSWERGAWKISGEREAR